MGDRLQEHQRTLHPVHAGDSEIGTGQARKRWQWSTHSLSAELQRNTRAFWRRLKIHVPGCVGHCGANGRYLTSQACVNSRAGGALPPKTIAGAPLCAVPRQRGDHCGFQFDLYGSRRIFPTRLKNARRFLFFTAPLAAARLAAAGGAQPCEARGWEPGGPGLQL